MNRELYNKKTDKAWNKVFKRIESDGLTTEVKYQGMKKFTINWRTWTAAACILFCIVLSTIYLIQPRQNVPLMAISNNDNSTALVHTLEDGSVIYLAGSSSLKYPKHFSSSKRETHLNGTAFFDVSHAKERPFLINTPSAQVEVLGTAFTIKQGDRIPFQISVSRGRVRVKKNRTGEEILVESGKTLTMDLKGMHLKNTINEEQLARFRHCIRFKDETVGNILSVVNNQINGQRIETTPGTARRHLTVSFCEDSPQMMAQLISSALGLRYSNNNGIITIQ